MCDAEHRFVSDVYFFWRGMMKMKLAVMLLAIGLMWTGSAMAIDVPDGDFETPALEDGAWIYVDDATYDTAWGFTKWGGTSWIGNNYSYGGLYPGMGHSGAQWIDMNSSYIHQALGATYEEGLTYEISAWVTTPTAEERLFAYFTSGGSDGWTDATILSSEFQIVPVSDNHTWNQLTFSYTATAEDDGKAIGFSLFGDYDTYVDDVAVVVPEPLTLSLLGLGSMCLIRRKRS